MRHLKQIAAAIVSLAGLWLICLSGGCVVQASPGPTVVSPVPPPPPIVEVPPPPLAESREAFIKEMAALFCDDLRNRVNSTDKLVLALAEAPQGSPVRSFYDDLALDEHLKKDFVIVQTHGSNEENAALSDLSGGPAEAAPDGTTPARVVYHPDSIYFLAPRYSESRVAGGGVTYTLEWRVTHPRTRQLIMHKTERRNLEWTGADWSMTK